VTVGLFAGSIARYTNTDAAGRFALDGNPPGIYTLRVFQGVPESGLKSIGVEERITAPEAGGCVQKVLVVPRIR
jgi:hypothetical protein